MISAQSFVLDGNGNRVDEQYSGPYRGGAGLAGQDAVHVSNRLTEIDGQPIIHDDEGRLLSHGEVATFTFNDRGQLIGAGDGVTYRYDGGGNRLQAIRDGRITNYIYDGAGTVIAEADANKTITRYYIHGATLLAMEEAGGNQYCYHSDAIGNTVAVSDPTGSLVNRYSYSPFGIELLRAEQFSQPFRYVGAYGVMTEPSGLLYMRARYYDPDTGRFLSEDPLGLEGGVNLYVYAGNNPVMFVDPEGEFWAQIIGGVIGAVAGGVSAYLDGGDVGDIARSATVGAAAGVLSTIPIPGINPLLGGAAMSATAGFLGNIGTQVSTGTSLVDVDYGSAAISAVAGGVGGGIGGRFASLNVNQLGRGPTLNSVRSRPFFTPYGQNVGAAAVGGASGGVLDAAMHKLH
jgi:RHS repeat-associated protein